MLILRPKFHSISLFQNKNNYNNLQYLFICFPGSSHTSKPFRDRQTKKNIYNR